MTINILLIFAFVQPNVRHAIESHLLDSSPQVRDAAVELIGKYMVELPKVAADYYPKIAERIAVRIPCQSANVAVILIVIPGHWIRCA